MSMAYSTQSAVHNGSTDRISTATFVVCGSLSFADAQKLGQHLPTGGIRPQLVQDWLVSAGKPPVFAVAYLRPIATAVGLAKYDHFLLVRSEAVPGAVDLADTPAARIRALEAEVEDLRAELEAIKAAAAPVATAAAGQALAQFASAVQQLGSVNVTALRNCLAEGLNLIPCRYKSLDAFAVSPANRVARELKKAYTGPAPMDVSWTTQGRSKTVVWAVRESSDGDEDHGPVPSPQLM